MVVLLGVLGQESDRGLVLVGSSYLDSCLKTLLKASFVEDRQIIHEMLGRDRPLGSFSSRMKIAYLLGLLELPEYRELDLIRKIRNDCGHSHEQIDLSNSPYRERILNLNYYEEILGSWTETTNM